MCNKLADELEQRIAGGVSVVPAGTKRILVTGTPLAVPNWKLHNIIETSGAVVVCEGGGDASVRLKLMEAVSALTGLGTDKIAICKGKG